MHAWSLNWAEGLIEALLRGPSIQCMHVFLAKVDYEHGCAEQDLLLWAKNYCHTRTQVCYNKSAGKYVQWNEVEIHLKKMK
jgi:hypothetical protein